MKKICFAILLSNLLLSSWSCENHVKQQEQQLSVESIGPQITSADSTHVSRNGNCHFQQYLESAAVPELAKQIFARENWDGNDGLALTFIDSLTANDTLARSFYFRLVTNIPSNPALDYREAFYMNATEYVTEHPALFISFFDHSRCFDLADMNVWADMVAGEYGIQAEEDIMPALNKLFKGMRQDCKSCTHEQKANLERFIAIIKEKV